MDDKRRVTVAVLSGKGGTGKTLVSVNLAAAAGRSVYADCDTEEPNGNLFFKPEAVREQRVSVKIPEILPELCTRCRKCVDFCAFHALAMAGGAPILFDEVCHSCGGCALVCPEGAIRERDKIVGGVFSGVSGEVEVHTGKMNIGEVSGIPIIKKLLDRIKHADLPVFIDCPPGSSCAVMESIRGADYCLLVAEPTVFGAHNLAMVHELAVLFGKPLGVLLNKCADGVNPSEAYCIENHVTVLGKIPYDAELGELNSEGKIAFRESLRFRELFASLLERVMTEVRRETAVDS